jgi:hypothetical protein
MTRFEGTDQFRGAEFVGVDMSTASFREVDMSGSRMRGAVLADADIDGYIVGLRVNGVEVEPLIDAELRRRHPERAQLRPTTPDGMRAAWTVIESMWSPTMARAAKLTETELNQSVDGEWSFIQTLRHLVFCTDAWAGHAIWSEQRPFHPLGLPASFTADGAQLGIDTSATPSYEDVLTVRDERVARLRDFLADVTQDDLDRPRLPDAVAGWAPPRPRTATECLHVIFSDEWAHHQFAIRDLAVIEAADER